jgi:hypothetical protein
VDELEAVPGKRSVTQDESLLSMKSNKAPVALMTRAVIWVVLSALFLFVNLYRILSFHAAQRAVGWWIYLQTAIWLVALVLWMRTGFLQWQARRAGER